MSESTLPPEVPAGPGLPDPGPTPSEPIAPHPDEPLAPNPDEPGFPGSD